MSSGRLKMTEPFLKHDIGFKIKSINFITLDDIIIILSSFISTFIMVLMVKKNKNLLQKEFVELISDDVLLERAVSISKEKIHGLKIKEVKGSKRVLPEWLLKNIVGVVPPPECIEIKCGGWGCIYKCGNYAVKVPYFVDRMITVGSSGDITMPRHIIESVAREAELIRNLDHHNVLKLLGYSTNPPLLVYEYAEYGSLSDITPVNEDLATIIGIHIFEGLRYLHSKNLCHEDVKPSNILIVDGIVKLGDFGNLVKVLGSISYAESSVCTRGYCAPEQLYPDLAYNEKRRGHECKVDVYQAANTILSILGSTPIDGSEYSPAKIELALSVVKKPKIRELLRSMLSREPWYRPSAREVLRQLLLIYETIKLRS